MNNNGKKLKKKNNNLISIYFHPALFWLEIMINIILIFILSVF